MSVILSTLDSAELPLIPAAPESALPVPLNVRMPDSAPLAPWACRFDGYLWVQRAGDGVDSVVPGPLRHLLRTRWLLAAFVHYTDTPVGPYSEVFVALLLRRGLRPLTHIPFMAVDSMESLRGGRANWALPKTVATFHGDPGTSDVLRADGRGWEISGKAHAFGPRVPMKLTLACTQVRPDGTLGSYSATVAGRARLARVDVEVASNASLPSWMPSGRHLAAHWLGGSLHVSPMLKHQN